MTGEFLAGTSTAIRAVNEDVELAARSSAPVLIAGETGCGKKAIARLIHDRSVLSQSPFTRIACSNATELPGALDAFKGTIFLHEIGEMNAATQGQLARLLEISCIRDVGSFSWLQPPAVRVIAATRQRLIERVQAHAFQEFLYYRLNIVYLQIPPLRDRRGDVLVVLAQLFELLSEAHQRPVPELDVETRSALVHYHWPGNVHELSDVAERLVLASHKVRLNDLPPQIIGDRGPTDGGPATSRMACLPCASDQPDRVICDPRGDGFACEHSSDTTPSLTSAMRRWQAGSSDQPGRPSEYHRGR